MIIWITGFLLILLVIYMAKNKVRINIKSFFKKGFLSKNNEYGLYCFVGKQGKGKTYSAIKFLEEQIQDRVILTNVYSYYYNVKDEKEIFYLENISDLIKKAIFLQKNNKKVIVFYDEIFTILEKKQAINKDILSFISQLRKREIIFITTAQEWLEINITFRRYCRYNINCNNINIIATIFFNQIGDAENMVFNKDLMDWESPIIQTNIFKSNLKISKLYDTLETIKVQS
jgi:hypothetical protein